MKKYCCFVILVSICYSLSAQNPEKQADSLKNVGLLMPALEKYGLALSKAPSSEVSYKIASTCALLWTKTMRDTAFYFLNYALQTDSTLQVLHDPQFLSLIEDDRWRHIEEQQIKKYKIGNSDLKNVPYAKALFRMIIKDQGFMYAGNLERKKYIQNGGYFSTPSIFPVLAMEEKNVEQNINQLIGLLDEYGWPTTSSVTEFAAAGAALIINHASHSLREKYFPFLKKAFLNGEAQPLRYAKMQDRLLVEKGRKQLFGTQIKFSDLKKEPFPIEAAEYVDKRRKAIGLGPLSTYLKARFGIDWQEKQIE